MQYFCPHKATSGVKSCEGPFATVRGWKGHMSRQHKEFTEEQLQAAVGNAPPSNESGRELFLSETEGITDTPPAGEKPGETKPANPEDTNKLKTEQAAKKLSAKFDKFQKKIAEKIPKALNEAIKEKGPEWQLSEEDAAMFSESIENCFEVLDVEFRIAPISAILSNPLWVLLLPAFVLLLIFGTKAVKNAPKSEEIEPEAIPVSA